MTLRLWFVGHPTSNACEAVLCAESMKGLVGAAEDVNINLMTEFVG